MLRKNYNVVLSFFTSNITAPPLKQPKTITQFSSQWKFTYWVHNLFTSFKWNAI